MQGPCAGRFVVIGLWWGIGGSLSGTLLFSRRGAVIWYWRGRSDTVSRSNQSLKLLSDPITLGTCGLWGGRRFVAGRLILQEQSIRNFSVITPLSN